MKINTGILLTLSCALFFNTASADNEKQYASSITSVKLYQNQAKITRSAKLHLKEGINRIVLSDLPPLLYDWSVRGSLPKDYDGKIVSLEIEKKALVKKRQKRILDIETRLEGLQEKDQILVDELKNIASQEKFLDSVLEFTNQTVSKELATRIPQISVWDNTLNYVTKKKSELLRDKRRIEKEREKIGKEIQKWEFELSQIAGYNYFKTYKSLNKVILENRSSMNIQQFADITGQYAERDKLLRDPSEKVDIVKRLIISIHSPKTADVDFTFSYVIPSTFWQMKYDIRANKDEKELKMVVYGDIYQKTGEDWNSIVLSLSTGKPVNAISPPILNPWYLDIYEYDRGGADEKKYDRESKEEGLIYKKKEKQADDFEPEIEEKGPYFEITMPVRQSIISSNKYQKKYIKDYTQKGEKSVRFFYEATPGRAPNGFLKVETTNTTNLPWLPGEAQIFLDNEFMGKVTIPFTPQGEKEEIVVGIESRIVTQKELVKKFEDTAGILGGKRRILYKYKIVLENKLPGSKELVVYDVIPVSRNKKISVEVENLSLPFEADKEFEKSTRYEQGVRKWKLNLDSHTKKEITYDIVISFDKDIEIRGIR